MVPFRHRNSDLVSKPWSRLVSSKCKPGIDPVVAFDSLGLPKAQHGQSTRRCFVAKSGAHASSGTRVSTSGQGFDQSCQVAAMKHRDFGPQTPLAVSLHHRPCCSACVRVLVSLILPPPHWCPCEINARCKSRRGHRSMGYRRSPQARLPSDTQTASRTVNPSFVPRCPPMIHPSARARCKGMLGCECCEIGTDKGASKKADSEIARSSEFATHDWCPSANSTFAMAASLPCFTSEIT